MDMMQQFLQVSTNHTTLRRRPHRIASARRAADRADQPPPVPCPSLQDPNIRRMTEAISHDPAFMEMAKEMHESILAGGMGGLSLGEGASPAGGVPGMMMPPGIDPSRYMEAMQRVMANPEFTSAAESLGRNLMSQSVSWSSVGVFY
jgi:hypothetical protein